MEFSRNGRNYSLTMILDEELKNVLTILSIDLRDKLRHKLIKTASNYKKENDGQILYNIKNQEIVVDEINKIISEGKNENISKACDYLSSCFVNDEEFPKEQNLIYGFCKVLWEMPEKKILQNWSKTIWQEVNKLQIKWIIQTIAEDKNLVKLNETLKSDKSDTLKWLNSVIEFLCLNNHESQLNLKTSPILPNQNGTFCIKDNLFLDDGEIDSILKDIAHELGYEVRDELLDIDIFLELPENRVRTQVQLAEEISKLIKPIIRDVTEREENKDVILKLYLWMNKNRLVAEEIFGEIYEKRFLLISDDEITANIEKAEILDEIIGETGFSPKEIKDKLKQLASISYANIDISIINEIISISGKIGGIEDILEHARELLQDKLHFEYMQEIGENVELVFKEALLQEGINADIIHQGWGSHDFEVRNPRNNKSMFIELKSFASGSSAPLKLAISQARKAIEMPDKFALCILERPTKPELIVPELIRKALKYRKGISTALQSAIQDNTDFERIKNNQSNIHLYISLREDVRVSVGYDFITSNCNDFTTLINDIKLQIN